jgi:tripartite-type tricarboxylate transporter receptor subunit TctC
MNPFKAALIALLVALPTAGAFADDYPSRPIRIIVPYPAGGPSDVAMRMLTEPLSRQLGQSIVVENRSGGGGQLGLEAAVQAERDGYTLVVGSLAAQVLIPAIKPTRYDPARDFIPLGLISVSPPVFAIRASLHMKTMAEVIAYAKAQPGKFTAGSAGVATTTHLAILLWANEAGVEVTHVPYRSTMLWVNDAVGNQIDSGFGEPKSVGGQIAAGTLTPIAVASPKRVPQLPDVPTMAEVGLPGVQNENWFGLMALAQTPAPIVERLKTAVRAAQTDPAYLALLARDSTSAGEPGADSFAELFRSDTARLTPLIRSMRDKLQ